MIITISGWPGSGKTTVGKLLARKLNYKFYSMGNLRGKTALEKNLTIDQLNKIGEDESWTDKDVDEYQKKLGEKEDNLIVEGRLSFHFIPKSLKIFLKVDQIIGAARIFNYPRKDEEKKETIEEMIEFIKKRVESDLKRYEKYYGINFLNNKNYDIIIITSNLKIDEVVEKILERIKNENKKSF